MLQSHFDFDFLPRTGWNAAGVTQGSIPALLRGEELASVLRRRAPDGCSCTSTIEIVVVVPGTGKAPEIDSYP